MHNPSWTEMEVADAEHLLSKLSKEDAAGIAKRHNFDILSHLYRTQGIEDHATFGNVGVAAMRVTTEVKRIKKPSPEHPPESG